MKKNLKDLHKSCNSVVMCNLFLIVFGSVLLTISGLGMITNFHFTDVIWAILGLYSIASGTESIIKTFKGHHEFEDLMYKAVHEYIERDIKRIKDEIENLVEEENMTPKVVE